jgi:YHS domain-containing protein
MTWTWISLLAVVGILAYLFLRRRHRMQSRMIDPVCGMAIAPAGAHTIRLGTAGPIYLCSQRCAATFDAAPRTFGGVVTPHRGAHIAC